MQYILEEQEYKNLLKKAFRADKSYQKGLKAAKKQVDEAIETAAKANATARGWKSLYDDLTNQVEWYKGLNWFQRIFIRIEDYI